VRSVAIDVGPGCQTPVQKWQTGDITESRIDKSKHVLIEVGGTAATNLHFHAGNKDTAEEILAKLESSRSIARGSSDSAAGPEAETASEPTPAPAPVQRTLPPPLRTDGAHSPGKKEVHFSEASPAIIPPRSPSPLEPEEEPPKLEEVDGLEAYALYDFQAQGDDELTVSEGDALWVIEQDGDEWWKCRDVKGDEGVVPASYIELRPSSISGDLHPAAMGRSPSRVVEPEAREDDGVAQRKAEERAAAERAEREAKEKRERKEREEREQRAKAAAMAAEVDRTRKEKEKREREDHERHEKERVQEEVEEEDRREKKSTKAKTSARPSSSKSSSDSRKSIEKRESLCLIA
jgi:actin cytoskeleton-regulatory complex protein SLA1